MQREFILQSLEVVGLLQLDVVHLLVEVMVILHHVIMHLLVLDLQIRQVVDILL